MDEETTIKAKALSAVICSVVDYCIVSVRVAAVVHQKSSDDDDYAADKAIRAAKDSVTIAIENLLDAGLE